jgi:hypothetical protein
VIAESGARREDRQKMILEGWRDREILGIDEPKPRRRWRR